MASPFIQKISTVFLAFSAVWLLSRLLMPTLAPFLLAVLLVLAAEPLVRLLQKIHLPRVLSSGVGITLGLLAAVALVSGLCAGAIKAIGALAGVLPDLEGTALSGIESLETWLLGLASRAPKSIRPILTRSLRGIFSDGTALLDQVSTKVLSMASGILKGLPDSALGIGTWVLASYMLSAKLPKIRLWAKAHLPQVWYEKYLPHLKQLKKSVGGWLIAQLKLTGVTFAVLTVGFWILQIRYAPLWGALVSLVDALPILGTGTVLIPWGIVCFLQGQKVRAVGLLAVYAVDGLIRSVLEPKFVGKQLGLDPLVTLFAMYAGYRFWGFFGMILSPLLAVTVTQLIPKQCP